MNRSNKLYFLEVNVKARLNCALRASLLASMVQSGLPLNTKGVAHDYTLGLIQRFRDSRFHKDGIPI